MPHACSVTCLWPRAARRFQYEDSGPRMLLLSLEESASGTNLTASCHHWDSSTGALGAYECGESRLQTMCSLFTRWRQQSHDDSVCVDGWLCATQAHSQEEAVAFEMQAPSCFVSSVRQGTPVGSCLLRLLAVFVVLASRRSCPSKMVEYRSRLG